MSVALEVGLKGLLWIKWREHTFAVGQGFFVLKHSELARSEPLDIGPARPLHVPTELENSTEGHLRIFNRGCLSVRVKRV
jgi:hypothetical protein